MSTKTIEFEKVKVPSFSTVAEWVSKCGQFHVVQYERAIRAYFKPVGWTTFGMGVRHYFDEHGEVLDTVSYDSVEKAQADCQEFFEVFGSEAKEDATL